MISFEGYVYFSAEDVEYIELKDVSDEKYPYHLYVHFKSGKSVSAAYSKKENRDRERDGMVRQIEFERRHEMEKLSNKLLYVADKKCCL